MKWRLQLNCSFKGEEGSKIGHCQVRLGHIIRKPINMGYPSQTIKFLTESFLSLSALFALAGFLALDSNWCHATLEPMVFTLEAIDPTSFTVTSTLSGSLNKKRTQMMPLALTSHLRIIGGQRKCLPFSPGSPGFDSRRFQEF